MQTKQRHDKDIVKRKTSKWDSKKTKNEYYSIFYLTKIIDGCFGSIRILSLARSLSISLNVTKRCMGWILCNTVLVSVSFSRIWVFKIASDSKGITLAYCLHGMDENWQRFTSIWKNREASTSFQTIAHFHPFFRSLFTLFFLPFVSTSLSLFIMPSVFLYVRYYIFIYVYVYNTYSTLVLLHKKNYKQKNNQTNYVEIFMFFFSLFFICFIFHFFLFISLLQILMPDKEKTKLASTVTEKRKADDIEIKDLKKVTQHHN